MKINLNKKKHKNSNLKVANTSLWVLGLSIIFAVVFGFYPFMQMNYNTTTVFSNAFYLATFRTAFAVGVALMIWLIACHSNSGGFIKWFLSLPQWQVIIFLNDFSELTLNFFIAFKSNGTQHLSCSHNLADNHSSKSETSDAF